MRCKSAGDVTDVLGAGSVPRLQEEVNCSVRGLHYSRLVSPFPPLGGICVDFRLVRLELDFVSYDPGLLDYVLYDLVPPVGRYLGFGGCESPIAQPDLLLRNGRSKGYE
jgi:hypothetical protein